MPLFLDTRGQPTLGIGLCARCSRKFPLADLAPDPNYPAMMVCAEDRDVYDPYRLAPRQPDNITLPFARPDLPLIPEVQATYYLLQQDGFAILQESGDFILLEDDPEDAWTYA
jgi:hypothetical protein